jgi:hypothetical protein
MIGIPISREDLRNRFTYHPPAPDQIPLYEDLRAAGLTFAERVVSQAPPSRETSLAVAHIEDAVMWANAAIARHG